MWTISADDPLAVAAVRAIRAGDVAVLRQLLTDNQGLASARLRDEGASRTLLHVVTEWPGNCPNGAATVVALVQAGADVNARFVGSHSENPLHRAASSDDVEVLDALLDAGADIEASGAVVAGGTALSDATAFGQWNAARRLIERGARSGLWESAALGLLDRVEASFAGNPGPSPSEITGSFWGACHGGQRSAAEYLLARDADLNWVGWDNLTPLDAAERSGATDVAEWLRALGARSTEGTARS